MANVFGTLFDNGGAVFNVKHTDFGAVGTGLSTTNDGPAIQAAIDAAATAGGGTVYFPSGRYRITSALKLDTTLPGHNYKGIVFRGVGWTLQGSASGSEGSMIQYDATTGSALELGPSTGSGPELYNFFMYDLGIMTQNTGYTGNLVKAYRLRNCGFFNCGFGGLIDATSVSIGALLYGNWWVDLHLYQCEFGTAVKGVQKAVLGPGFTDSVDNVSFDNCLFYRCDTAVDIPTYSQSVSIDQSTFEAAIGGGASLVKLVGESNKVRNCWFGDSNGTGTWVQMGGEAGIVTGNYITLAAVGVDLPLGTYEPEVSTNYISDCATAVQAATVGLKMRGNFIYVLNGANSSAPGLGLDLSNDMAAKVEFNEMRFPPGSVGYRVGYKLASGTTGVLEDLASDPNWGTALVQNSAGTAWITLLRGLAGSTLTAPNLVSSGSLELKGTFTMTGAAGSPSSSTRFISDAGSSNTFYHNVPSGGAFLFADAGTTMLQLSRGSTVDDDTALLVLRRTSGTWSLARVSQGAPNSAGTGYRVLRIPNT